MRYLAALLAMICAAPALAEAPPPFTYRETLPSALLNRALAAKLGTADNGSGLMVTPSGATAARALASIAGDRHTVRDWGAACNGIADDSTALATAATALRGTGQVLEVPGNCRLRLAGAAQVWLKGMTLRGPGVRDMGPAYGNVGGTIILDDTAQSPFVVSDAWAMDGLTFFWPRQVPQVSPIPFPALIATHGSDNVQSWRFENNQVTNAFDLIDLTTAGAGSGHFFFRGNTVFAMRRALTLAVLGGESFFTDNQFTHQPYLYVAGTLAGQPMTEYYGNNGEMLRVVGNGTNLTRATQSVDGLRMSNNYGLLFHTAIHVTGGLLNLAQLTGNTFDQVPQVLVADNGGAFTDVHVTGGLWLAQHYQHTDQVACPFEVKPGAAPGNILTLTGVAMAAVAGPAVCFTDTGAARLTITGGQMLNVGNVLAVGNFPAVQFTSPGGILSLVGVLVNTSNVSNVTEAVKVFASQSHSIVGNTFDGWNSALRADAGAGQGTFASNTMTRTTPSSGSEYVGTGLARTVITGNSADLERNQASLRGALAGQAPQIRASGEANVNLSVAASGTGIISLESTAVANAGLVTTTIDTTNLPGCGIAGVPTGRLCRGANNVVQVTP
jgi:hypothetical protein